MTTSGMTPEMYDTTLNAPAELAQRCRNLLPHDGVLDCDELEQLVRTIAADPSLWEPLVVEDRQHRRYRLLFEDERIDVWVLSWMPGQGTGFHDHDISGVGLCGARGTVIEKQMVLPAGTSDVHLAPGISRQGPGGYIHSVAHESGEPAVTIHAYSPRLDVVGQYRVDGQGVLCRDIENGRQELLDHTIAERDPARA